MTGSASQRLAGTGIACYAGQQHEALVTLDLENYCLLAQHPQMKSEESMLRDRYTWMRKPARLLEVRIPTINGELRAPEIKGLLITSYGPGAFSVFDSALERALQRTPTRAGIVTLKLLPASSLVHFEYQPRSLGRNELLYHAGVPKPHPFHCTVRGTRYEVAESHDHLSIRSEESLWGDERRIQLALSLLQGAPVTLLGGYEAHTAHVNFARPSRYQQSHPLHDNMHDVPDLFEALLSFFLPLARADFRRWEKAVFFFLEGKSAHVELDLRVTHLFMFLEMFDESRTLSAAPLAQMLDVSLSDARLICEVRNRVVHQHHDLTDALAEADRQLQRMDANYRLSAFDLAGPPAPAPTHFCMRLIERINAYIVRQVGWTRAWHDYRYLFAASANDGD